jgi:hypothetical protein
MIYLPGQIYTEIMGNIYQQGESRIEVGGVRKQIDVPSVRGPPTVSPYSYMGVNRDGWGVMPLSSPEKCSIEIADTPQAPYPHIDRSQPIVSDTYRSS